MTALEQPPASVPDFAALKACRHPVAYAHELTDAPIRRRLLGEDLVLWRDSGGTPHALRDLCIHRGTALSLGRVVGDRIMCPYHGWQYGGDGVCTLIPQLADPTRIPGKAKVDAFALRGALRAAVGGDGGAALRAPGDPGVRGPGLDRRARRPVRLERRRLPPARELHRLRALPVGPPGPARRPRAPRRAGLQRAHRRATSCTTTSSAPRRPTATTSRSSPTRPQSSPSAAAATSCTCRTRSCCGSAGAGRRGWSTSSARSRSTRTAASATSRSAATTTASSPTASCRTSRTRSSSRTATSSSPSGRSACRSTSRPRCT